MIDGPYWSLKAAYLVVVSLWLCLHVSTSQSRHRRLGQLEKGYSVPDRFLLMCHPITSPRSKSLSSPDLPMLLVLLSNEQHSDFCLLYTSKCGRSDI
jgi:hypothetical protein